jgi:threonine dehydratase
MLANVDEVIAVSEDSMLCALRLVHKHLGLAEPVGVAGLAAVLTFWQRFLAQRVVTILCGSNVARHQIRRWLFEESPAFSELQ